MTGRKSRTPSERHDAKVIEILVRSGLNRDGSRMDAPIGGHDFVTERIAQAREAARIGPETAIEWGLFNDKAHDVNGWPSPEVKIMRIETNRRFSESRIESDNQIAEIRSGEYGLKRDMVRRYFRELGEHQSPENSFRLGRAYDRAPQGEKEEAVSKEVDKIYRGEPEEKGSVATITPIKQETLPFTNEELAEREGGKSRHPSVTGRPTLTEIRDARRKTD